jgi:hypothetical protein
VGASLLAMVAGLWASPHAKNRRQAGSYKAHPRTARGAHPPALEGEGHPKITPTLVAAGARRARGQ